MSMAWRSFAVTIILCGVCYSQLHAREVVCHIHAPDDYTPFSDQPLVIPAVGDRKGCEELNRLRFGSRGRCHCVEDSIGMDRPGPIDFMQFKTQEGQLP